jgi:hypothetical protein
MTKKNTPLLMKSEMIVAYMAKIKCQTRRLRGLEKINQSPDDWELIGYTIDQHNLFMFKNLTTDENVKIKCPYGGPGDGLLFKEKYRLQAHVKGIPKNPVPIWYVADGAPTWGLWGPAKPSIFMPLWAIRHNPTITAVTAARLQDITPLDCVSEGASVYDTLLSHDTHIMRFKNLWDSINGKKYPWSKNPWVWPISFEKYEAGL